MRDPESVASIMRRLQPNGIGEAPHTVLVKPCICGGQVRADVRFPQEGVSRHNRTKLHQAWRARAAE